MKPTPGALSRSVRRWRPDVSRLVPVLPVLLLMAVALAIRLYGINWDQGNLYHPDERSIYMRVDCMYRTLTEAPNWKQDCASYAPFQNIQGGVPSLSTFFSAEKSALNPHWFPLGSILIYTLLIIKFALSPVLHTDLQDLAMAGRTLGALADAGSVAMMYALGARLYGRRVGLLAAALFAFTATAIQISHFYRPEPFLVLLALLSIWAMLNLIERGRVRDAALTGLSTGLMFAFKVSSAPMLVLVALAFGARLFWRGGAFGDTPPARRLRIVARDAAVGAAVALAVFAFWMPYALIDFGQLVDDYVRETNIIRHPGTVPYTVQYIGTPAFWYEIRQTSVWGMGLPLGIIAWGGLLLALWRLFRRKLGVGWGEMLVLAWVVAGLVLVGFWHVKFLRYVYPVAPFLVLLGARALVGAADWTKAHMPRLEPLAVGVAASVVVATALWGIAFITIYSRPHTGVQASDWVNANVTPGATILTDNHWDEGFPALYRYRLVQIPIFEGDTQAKMQTLARNLAAADYILFYSNRTYGSVTRVPERYPYSANYYRLLFSGGLGYQLEKQFTSYPTLPGIAFADDTYGRAGLTPPVGAAQPSPAPITLNLGYADENVIDYDHPKVLLFRNVGRVPEATLRQRLTDIPPQATAVPTSTQLLSPREVAVQRQGGNWSTLVKPGAWAARFPAVSWLLLIELMSLAAMPLAWVVFRPLPDRGLLLTKPLGVLAVAYVAWVLASLPPGSGVAFSRASTVAGLLAVGVLSGAVLLFKRREFFDFARRRWLLLLIGEAVFLAAFLSFLALRAANPDLWHPYRGGEKPMELAYLTAVFRSSHMPPYDPWLSGGAMNYYYWGYFLVATPMKALGIDPAVGFNLAVPLLAALAAAGAFAVVYNLTEGVRRVGERRPWIMPHSPWGPVVAGVLAATFVVAIGNLDGMVQLIDKGLKNFDYWRSSRMIPDLASMTPSALRFWLPHVPKGAAPDVSPHITEFPFFSYLFADLHAHMMALPFTILAIGLALALMLAVARPTERPASGGSPRDFRSLAPTAVALAVVMGALAPMNTWDYPSYALLAVAAAGAGALLRPGTVGERVALFVAVAGAVVAMSFLAWLPYHLRYQAPSSGAEVSKWSTPLWSYLGQFGLFVFILGGFLIAQIWHRGREGSGAKFQVPSSKFLSRRWPLLLAAVALFVFAYLGAAGYWTAGTLALFLGAVAWLAIRTLLERREETPFLVFPLLMVGLALCVSIGVDFIRLKGDIGRMNTQFKYYLEVWVLLALASAYALWHLSAEHGLARGLLGLGRSAAVRAAFAAGVGVLVLSSLVYTGLGARARLNDRFDNHPEGLTLNGQAYMQTAVYNEWDNKGQIVLKYDYEAIQWLKANAQGSPPVLEGVTSQYRWGARIADNTGLPALVGWQWHQEQQRGKLAYVVDGRVSLVYDLYTMASAAQALDLLRQYGVQYVVLGDVERHYYPGPGLNKFDAMVGKGLEVAFQNERTKIYRVTG